MLGRRAAFCRLAVLCGIQTKASGVIFDSTAIGIYSMINTVSSAAVSLGNR